VRERAVSSRLFLYRCDMPTSVVYINNVLCNVIGCYGYDVNSAAVAARANDKDESSAIGTSYTLTQSHTPI